MGFDAAMRMSEACQQMGQFMEQCPFHLFPGDLAQGGIEPDLVPPQDGHSSRGPHAPVPTDDKASGKVLMEWLDGATRLLLQLLITTPDTGTSTTLWRGGKRRGEPGDQLSHHPAD